MTKTGVRTLGWMLAALLLAPSPALAQFSGAIQGTVTDAQKAVVADAVVMVTNTPKRRGPRGHDLERRNVSV